MKYVKQLITDYTSSDISEATAEWSASILTAGAFVVGKTYTIVSVGTTNFVTIGAASSTVGVVFTATGVGTGTGTAQITYNVGDTVLYGNYIWKNAFTANVNHTPEDGSNYWVKWNVSNKYSLIDMNSTSYTVVNTDLVCTFPLGNIDTLAIGYFTAASITIENLDASNNVLLTQSYTQSINEDVFDYYDYMYSDYTLSTNMARYWDIVRAGTQLRVSFDIGLIGTYVSVGFMVGGQAVDMGRTLDNVKIGFKSYSIRSTDPFGITTITKRAAQDFLDFETVIDSILLMPLRRKAKTDKDETVAFIIDESPDSIYENIVTLGVSQDMQIVASNFDKTILTWSVIEMI